jgi:DNA replication protein DnaC
MQNQFPKRSAREALETYKHIDLTPEEEAEAILWGKQKKERLLESQELERRAAENRRKLVGTKWSYEQTKGFMEYRAKQIFPEKGFTVDQGNRLVYDLLCYYFSRDETFVSIAQNAGVQNPSMDKGIMLAGVFGTGKTTVMKLFQKNQRQVYFMRSAKQLADEYQANGVEAAEIYQNKFKNAVGDGAMFFQPFSALCIDDIGSEDVKKHFGNERNVIGDIIENRYSRGNVGIWLHATTNLTGDQIEQYYGGRVRSRMREIFNFIELGGGDRRK